VQNQVKGLFKKKFSVIFQQTIESTKQCYRKE